MGYLDDRVVRVRLPGVASAAEAGQAQYSGLPHVDDQLGQRPGGLSAGHGYKASSAVADELTAPTNCPGRKVAGVSMCINASRTAGPAGT